MGGCCGTQSKDPRQREHQLHTWARTGIVVLSNRQLKDADLEKYDLPAAASLVDISSNALTCLPQALLSLGALQKLNASHNQLSALVPSGLWFPKLKVLNLDRNNLRQLPPLSGLPQLQELTACNNKLEELSYSVADLKRLSLLKLTNNLLVSLPASIGECELLQEADLAGNRLQALPEGMSSLSRLKTLRLDDNRLTSLPAQLLVGCMALQTLSLHGNTCDVEALHAMPGFADYERRRQRKADKVVQGAAMVGSSTFDAGLER